jgi:isoquinoline 1-oxidoreductase alpha subunit
MTAFKLQINNREHLVDADESIPLLWVIRDTIGFTGTKYGCGIALCGSCTVLVDGEPNRSCQLKASSMVGRKITTIEGLAQDSVLGQVAKKVQQVWNEKSVGQCGYCQSGQMIAATKLLSSNPKPTDDQINDAMDGYLCRCGSYMDIRRAIKTVADGLG